MGTPVWCCPVQWTKNREVKQAVPGPASDTFARNLLAAHALMTPNQRPPFLFSICFSTLELLQINSFETDLPAPPEFASLGAQGPATAAASPTAAPPFRAVFIRAPAIVETGPDVEVLSEYRVKKAAEPQGGASAPGSAEQQQLDKVGQEAVKRGIFHTDACSLHHFPPDPVAVSMPVSAPERGALHAAHCALLSAHGCDSALGARCAPGPFSARRSLHAQMHGCTKFVVADPTLLLSCVVGTAVGVVSMLAPALLAVTACAQLEKVAVAVRQGKLLATAFHPELTADLRW